MAGTTRGKRSSKRARAASNRAHRSGNPAKPVAAAVVQPATARDWIGAARLRTLPLAIAPVLVGSGAAMLVERSFHWVLALCCLAIAVLLQVGVNYANDYSDGVRGTDDVRVGPARLTGAGKAAPRTVLIVALVCFALAGLVGIAVVIRTQHWWMLAIGAACIVAAWFYTGGKRPYGYAGLGEVFVFVFFGLVATVGTTFVQVGSVPQESWFGAVAVGSLACAVLLANNLRDIDQDRLAGKRTLSVRIGRIATKVLFTLLMLVPFAVAAVLALFYPLAWLVMLAAIPAAAAVLIVWTYRAPRELVVALGVTSLTALLSAALLAWAFVG